ncbi:hypothetical protein B0T16DRAFT_463253 [Cercophora newfieldiana]|uniref:Uncharacterized protein n=1 Tax=Cercophora newfieldiana TaxID=92897 RepID=A0AA39XTX4_9PEZI|nr:hypothetical protein B0T16DRAFT_463253 [Cercophora newfieldiana]
MSGHTAVVATDVLQESAQNLAKRFSIWLRNRQGEECGVTDGANDDEDSDTTGLEQHDNGITAAKNSDFIQSLVKYHQNTRAKDDGEMLEKLIGEEKGRVLIRVSKDRQYSKTGEAKKEKQERIKRHACHLLNEIVDNLWPTLQWHCLQLYDFFAEQNIRLTKISRRENRSEFIQHFVNELAGLKIPDSSHAFYPAVLITWLRGPSYQDTCRAIGLTNLANLNMDAELAKCEQRLMQGGVGHASRIALVPRWPTDGAQENTTPRRRQRVATAAVTIG